MGLGVKMHSRTNLLHEERTHKKMYLSELEYLCMFVVVLVLQ